MEVKVKSSNGIQIISDQSVLAEKRMYFLTGDIDEGTANDFVKAMMYFYITEPTKPVKVFITSDGGEISAGMAIYDTIQGLDMPVELYCLQKAYSMAAVIFASGKHGRYILPHSKVMIHEPLIMNGASGKTSSIKKLSEDLCKTKKEMDELIAKHTGRSMEEVDTATSENDTYYTADEAVDFGLADKVMYFEEMLKHSAK